MMHTSIRRSAGWSYFRQRGQRPFSVVTLLLLTLVLACGRSEAPDGAPGGASAGGGVPVEVTTLAPKPVDDVTEYVGTLRSRRSTTIQPQAEGFLTKILVKSGDRVAPGTPMFEIDAIPQQAAVA